MIAAPAARALLASAATLLDQGRSLDRLSHLLTGAGLLALIGMAVVGVHALVPTALLGLSVLAGLAQVYYAIRVGFDAGLLRALAKDTDALDPAELDAALTSMRLLAAGKAGRPIDQRVAGACRLFYRQALMVGLQLVLFLLGGAVAALS
jgi:hypothetical protein